MADKNKDKENEEFALFRKEMRDATPLQHDVLLHEKPKPVPKARRHLLEEEGHTGETFSDMYAPESVGNEEYLEYRGPEESTMRDRMTSALEQYIEVLKINPNNEKARSCGGAFSSPAGRDGIFSTHGRGRDCHRYRREDIL